MKQVTIKVEAGHTQDSTIGVSLFVEAKETDGRWTATGASQKVLSGMPDMEIKLGIDVGQRIVIEGVDEPGYVYDAKQMMAVPAPPPEPPPPELLAAKEGVTEEDPSPFRAKTPGGISSKESGAKEVPKGPISGQTHGAPSHKK